MKRSHKKAPVLIGLLILLLGGASTILWIVSDNSAIRDVLTVEGLLASTAIVLTTLANIGLRFLRWHMLVRSTGARIQLKSSIWIFTVGLMMIITPLYLGEFAKSVLLNRRHGVKSGAAAGVVVAERLSDLVAVILLGLLWFASRDQEFANVVYIVVAIGILLILTRVILARGRHNEDLDSEKGFVETVRNTFTLNEMSVSALILSIGAWGCAVVGLNLTINTFGGGANFATSAAAFAGGTLLGAVSAIPAGTGVVGSIEIVALTSSGVPQQAAVTSIFLHRMLTVWFAFAVGAVTSLVYLPGRFSSPDQEAHEHFDEISSVYDDQIPEHLRDHVFESKFVHIRDAINATRSGSQIKVLDLGCGGGDHTEAVSRIPGVRVTGIDASEGQVSRAAARFAENESVSNTDISFLVADVTNLPFDSNSIDFAFAVNSLHHLPSRDAQRNALAEIKRVLRPNGHFLLMEMNTDSFLVRTYLGYLFPLVREIDDGTEIFIPPSELSELTNMKVVDLEHFGFTPDFTPPALMSVGSRIERRLEKSPLRRFSVHYAALFSA